MGKTERRQWGRIMAYTEFDYQILVTQLGQYSDPKYRAFHSGLGVGSAYLYGVRTPKLREMAKRISAGDWRSYLEVAQDNSYEEIMLQGMVITQAKCELEEILTYAELFVEKIDNWAICDTFCAGFKAARENRKQVLSFLKKYVVSEKEFERRFAVVMLMDYFLIDEYMEEALELILKTDKTDYYVMMASA